MISSNEPDIMLLTEIIPKAQRNTIYEAQMNENGMGIGMMKNGYEKFRKFQFFISRIVILAHQIKEAL